MQEPLTGGDDAGSQRSSSGASLLERIRMQRAQSGGSGGAAPASTIQVPNYNPVATEQNFAGGGPAAAAAETTNTNSNFFSSAWNNISESMETGMASLQQEGYESSDQALLPPSYDREGGGEEDYSMTNYFMTFVNDVYKSFLGLPLLVRLTMIFALLFTAFKLM